MGLRLFLLKRLTHGLFVILGVLTVVFLLRSIAPGNPVDMMVGLEASAELRAAVARDLGLNEPLHVQYFTFLTNMLRGHLGFSYITGTPVSDRLLARLPATIELAVAATVLAVLVSIPLGVISATRRNQFADYNATLFSLAGISTPNFWLGIMLILVLSVHLGLFPTSRRPIGFGAAVLLLTDGDLTGLATWAHHIALPTVTLGTYFTALLMRLTRNGMLDELGKSYVRALRAKGLPETRIRYIHALRNTLIPIITVVGLQFGILIGGAVVVEAVFAWPGLGTVILEAINRRDWPMIQGTLVLLGIAFVVINLCVDILYTYVNPQVGYE